MKAPKITRWVLSPHALARIQERKMSGTEFAQIIETPDIEIPQVLNLSELKKKKHGKNAA
jgi:hypothetical protein